MVLVLGWLSSRCSPIGPLLLADVWMLVLLVSVGLVLWFSGVIMVGWLLVWFGLRLWMFNIFLRCFCLGRWG